MNMTELSIMFFSLLAVLNPLVVATIYTSMIEHQSKKHLRKTIRDFTLAVMITLIISIWLGQWILLLFGINIAAFSCAGGLILIIVGTRLILPKSNEEDMNSSADETSQNISIIPLAIPLCAGPGVIAMLITYSIQRPLFVDHLILSVMAVILSLICGFMLHFAPPIGKRLGSTGLKAVNRIM
jgi:multiple antibiotic resistance protein